MWSARWKLVCLWFSQVARVTADNALRFFVCLDYARHGEEYNNSAWYLVTAIFMAPAILLAPLNGALCNTLPKSSVLKGAALFGFLVMGAFALHNGDWLWCWALIALGSAIYGPTRYAMLPAAAVDTKWPLTRINGFFEMGAAAAIISGLILILGTDLPTSFMYTWIAAVVVIFLLNGFALLTALPVDFPSDLRRDDAPWQAVRGFFADCRAIWNEREARICLFGLSGLRGLITGMTGALLPRVFAGDGLDLSDSARIAGWVAGGMALGSLLAGLQKHPRRVLGLVPWGGIGLTAGLMWAASGDIPGDALCAFFGIMAGLVNVPLAATYQAALPPDARGNGMAIRNMTDYLFTAATAVTLFVLARQGGSSATAQLWLLAGIAAGATFASWWIFCREVVEQLIEGLFAVMYRFRAAGPGLDQFPLRGPVLIVANHSGYGDPMWLAKVLPRTIIPMMTSIFFDHPLLRWCMVYLADAIRVEHSGFRREVPELQTAIGRLDQGQCLVIFPEGRLRRTEDQPLKLFGQGVWHILSQRPHTPVVVCWIEGGWGSFFSYFNGKPTKNKPFDIRHPISIAVGEPHVLGPEILADHRKTRQYLMKQCLAARQYLGLGPYQLKEVDFDTAEKTEQDAD